MNKVARHIAIMLAVILIGSVFLSMFIDLQYNLRTVKEVHTIMKVAGRDSARSFQTQNFNDYIAPEGNVDTGNVNNYKKYLSNIEDISRDNNYMELNSLCKFLSDDVSSKINRNEVDQIYTPLQFDLTYLDKDGVKKIFSDEVAKLFKYNFDENYNQLRGKTAMLDSITVSIDDPKVIDFQKDESDLTYAKIFGTNNREKSISNLLDSVNRVDPAKYGSLWGDNFNQVVAYEVTYTINWKYICQSELFRINPEWGGDPAYIYSGTGAIMIPQQPVVLTLQYVLTN